MPIIFKSILSALIMGIVIFILERFVMPSLFQADIAEIRKINQFIWILIEFVIGVIVFMGSAFMLKADQARDIVVLGKDKIRSIFGKI